MTVTDRTLKPGWTWVKFGEVVRLGKERCADPLAEGIERYVGLEHIDPDNLRILRWGNVADGTTFTNRFLPGQVLFGKRRAYQRKVAVADFAGICSGDIYVFESQNPAVLLPELLPFICQTEGFYEHAVGTSAGSLSPRTNWTQLAKYEFALPPVEEQKRMSCLLLCVRNAREASDSLLTRARQCLQAALDTFFREGQANILSIDAMVKEGLIFAPQDGNHGGQHPKSVDYVSQGIPFLMASDVRDGHVDLVSCKFIPRPLADRLRIGFAHENDILLTHKGTVGEVAFLRGLSSEYAMLTPQVTYYRIRDDRRIAREYLYYAFQSTMFRRQLAVLGRQSTRDYVPITTQRQLSIPVPALDTQLVAVRMLRSIDACIRGCISHITMYSKVAYRLQARLFSA